MVYRICLLLLLFMLPAALCYSQCNSSTGTPLVNETFGSGPDFGPPLPAGITNMQYIASSCPEDGQYTIANSTSGCYSVWHTLTDHTGDPYGYFMLINASYLPSDFYLQTINGLCSGTTYFFSAWVINMYTTDGAIMPNITFTIEKPDGTLLAPAYNSGDIPVINPATWEKYGFYFKTPDGVSTVVIRMHNNADGGIGNDLAIDDIGFSPAGPTIAISTPGVSNNILNNYCFNKTITLLPTIGNCYVNNTYQWQSSPDGNTWTDIAGQTNPGYSFTVQNPGTTLYRLNVAEMGNIENVNCRVNSNTITVISAHAGINNTAAGICYGSTYTLPSGKTVNKTGSYSDTVRSVNSCDSLITNLALTVAPPITETQNVVICPGQSYGGHSIAGNYIDTLVSPAGCDTIRTLNLTVYSAPEPNLGPNQNICFGDTVTLSPGTFSSYLWQDKSTLPYYRAGFPGIYWVKVYDNNGCEAIDSVTVNVSNCSPIIIPNTFSPNNDGINDTWKIAELTIYKNCNVQIFNRYGSTVFTSKGLYKPWDGKLNGKQAPVGTYYYIIDVADIKQKFSGWLLLVR